jgi:hypothetical protein
MEIKNEEIEYAAQVILNDLNAFYTGDVSLKTGKRAEIIKSMESTNILACPGSGKTTVLLAKLLILGKRTPFQNGRGICVFTHTNVAIDEIKHKLGAKTDSLFTYPNFFGTIQQFVNKYLAIPSFVHKHGFRPQINNDYYYEAVRRKYESGALMRSQVWIQSQVSHSRIPPYVYVGNLRFNLRDKNIITNDILSSDHFANPTTPTYNAIQLFKNQIFNDGYLSYDDAYVEAFEQLNNPTVIEAIRNRFQFVFVDEMQDSGSHQLEILDRIFNDQADIIYQRFGDVNQAIYSDGNNHGAWMPTNVDSIQISDTKRFSNSICQVINNLRINKSSEENLLTSSSNQPVIRPTVILFLPENIKKVIPKYAQIINDLNIRDEKGHYAIGRIAKEPQNGSHSLLSYYPEFDRSFGRSREIFNCLESYLLKSSNKDFSVKERYDSIINSILHLLEIENIKNELTRRKYTKRTLLQFLQTKNETKYHELREIISDWLYLDSINKIQVTNYLIELISEFWERDLQINHSFFTENHNQDEPSNSEKNNRLYFNFPPGSDENLVTININTVNGEKGRTHTSSLYLETYKNTYDVEKMIGYMSGSDLPYYVRGAKVGQLNLTPTQQMLIKFGYVGMSRAQKLLCVAVRSSVVNDDMKIRLQNNGWDINEDLCNI